MTWGRHVHTRKVANELVPSVASKNSAPFAPESTLIWSSPPQRNVRLAPASETNSPPYGQLYKTLNPVAVATPKRTALNFHGQATLR